ncbi:MAG: hypothetical protein AAGD01_01025 [Acidobacteriota bacterium]
MRSIKLPSWIERLLGTAPVPPPPHVFVLGESRLTYAHCAQQGRQVELSRYRSVLLEEPAVASGLLGGAVRQPQALTEAVQELCSSLPEPVSEASLVLPEEWFRVVFADVASLPTAAAERQQVLQWKLKRLVPFRVEDLRLSGTVLSSLPQQEEPVRVMIGFALDELLRGLEASFEEAGINLGWITGASLLSLDALRPVDDQALTALALVQEGGYTLIFCRGEEPILHRFKAADSPLPEDARRRLVERDLKLSRNFLDERFPGAPFQRVLLAASAGLEGHWEEWLQETLEAPVELVGENHVLPVNTDFDRGAPDAPTSWLEVLPILGIAQQEVA